MSGASWTASLRRALDTHGATVLHGRVADHLPDEAQALRPITAWLYGALCGPTGPARRMVVVDPAGRLRFFRGEDAGAFGRAWQGEPTAQAGGGYDLGEEPEVGAPAQIAVADLLDGIAERPQDFVGWLVVVDFAHLTTADASRLEADGRALALAGSQLVRAAAREALAGRAAPHLMWITRNLGQLPVAVYQGDPRVHLVAVPEPSLAERRAWLTHHGHAVRCKAPKASAGDRRPDRVLRVEALAELTEGLSFVDLAQILALASTTAEPLTPDALLNLYRYGDERSPWEELDEAKVRVVEALLSERVFGQPGAVAHVAAMIRRAWLGLSGLQHSARNTAPKGKLFFVGPTGVGKTELAKALAHFLFGDERACLRFDMSEYNHEHSDQRLVGAPPGYVGFEQGGQLTNAVRERPFSVLLFDEIEKAHGRILDKFLQILEDGRLTDGRGETAWFGETVILFTSNLGAADMPAGADGPALAAHFRGAVERHFNEALGRPELLNRLGDHIVPFGRVDDAEVRGKLLERKLRPILEHLQARFGVRLRLTAEAKALLVAQARAIHGGRGLLNAIERALVDPLSAWMMEHLHQLTAGRVLVAQAEGAALVFELIDD